MKTANRVLAVILIVASLLCLVGVGISMKDILDAKDKWTETGEEAAASINQLRDGVSQLSENFDTFADGVVTYEEGLVQLEAGKKQVEEGEKTIAEGEETLASSKETLKTGEATYYSSAAQLAAAHRSYNEAVEKLNQGKADYAAGLAELEANRQAYEEGKQKLALVAPIYAIVVPAYNNYNNALNKYNAAVAAGDDAGAAAAKRDMDRYDGIVNTTLLGTGYSIGSICAEYEAGQEQIAVFEAGQAKIDEAAKTIADSEAQLAQAKATLDSKDGQLAAAGKKISDGRDAIADGEKDLEAGKIDLANGKETVAAGEIELAEGRAKLQEYEDGEAQLIAGLETLISTDTNYTDDGKAITPSIADRLGSYSYWLKDENGEDAVWLGSKVVDLDKALLAADAGDAFLADTQEAVTKEITGRLVTVLALAAAAILGIVGGILGLVSKNLPACILSWIAFFGAIMAIVLPSFGSGFSYPLCAVVNEYSIAILGFCVILSAVSLAYVVVNMCTKPEKK